MVKELPVCVYVCVCAYAGLLGRVVQVGHHSDHEQGVLQAARRGHAPHLAHALLRAAAERQTCLRLVVQEVLDGLTQQGQALERPALVMIL